MSPTAVVLVLVSATCHVGWNYLTKSSANPKAYTLWKGMVFIGIAVCALPMLPVASIPAAIWGYMIASGILHALYLFALTTSYETGEISFVYPIARSAPAFVPFGAFLVFGETLSLRGIAGVAVVVISTFLVHLRGDAPSYLRRLRASLGQRDSAWALVTLATVVTYSLVDKSAMVTFRDAEEVPHALRGLLYFLVEGSICHVLFSLYAATRRDLNLRAVLRREWWQVLLGGVGMLLSYSLILHVMQSEPVSYIVALRQASVLFAVLLGWLLLKESYGRLRLLASAGMVAGLVLVATA